MVWSLLVIKKIAERVGLIMLQLLDKYNPRISVRAVNVLLTCNNYFSPRAELLSKLFQRKTRISGHTW